VRNKLSKANLDFLDEFFDRVLDAYSKESAESNTSNQNAERSEQNDTSK